MKFDHYLQIEEVLDKVVSSSVAFKNKDNPDQVIWYPYLSQIYWKVGKRKLTLMGTGDGGVLFLDMDTGIILDVFDNKKDFETNFEDQLPTPLVKGYLTLETRLEVKESAEKLLSFGTKPPIIEIDHAEDELVKQLSKEVSEQQVRLKQKYDL